MVPLRIAIIGFGKIARDQHVPSIVRHDRLELVATTSRQGAGVEGLPSFANHLELLNANLDLSAVAICTPPSVRYNIARDCLDAGLHVLLEKPPAVTLAEIEDLACHADGLGRTLFATWHARFNPAVEEAARLLAGQEIERFEIEWREDVRKWHPGQQWIWEPGGFGVFDPGINAFSIATSIFPGTLFVKSAELEFPENRQAPIAAHLKLTSARGGDYSARLDWRAEAETWDIGAALSDGTRIDLREGGSKLFVNGALRASGGIGEYPMLYERFVELIDQRSSDVDLRPLRLVADAYLTGHRRLVSPFID